MPICHMCQRKVPEGKFCPRCTQGWNLRQAAETMTPDERVAELELLRGPLMIPFDKLHKRIEELVGRPVWSHELGLDYDGLIEEARGDREPVSMADIIGLLPQEKVIVAIVGGD